MLLEYEKPSFSRSHVLVVGDVMLDRYLWSEVSRISPEAPVPVVRVKEKDFTVGGAANVAANLSGLGCRVTLLGVRGEDEPGRQLSEKLWQMGIEDTLLRDGRRSTTTKTRVVAQGQQLIRIDEEQTEPLRGELIEELFHRVKAALNRVHAVVLSDYGKGVLSVPVCRQVIGWGRQEGIPVLVDPKGKDWERYRHAACITPNEAELKLAASAHWADDEDLIGQAAKIRQKFELAWLLVTRGAKGMVLLGPEREPVVIPAKPKEVFDVSGAGDTVIATVAAGVGSGMSWYRAARLANAAAGVVVSKLGTHPIRSDELEVAVRFDEMGSFHKVCGLDDARRQVECWRAEGERIVFTNGCFDLLHAGHVKLLHAAAMHGTKLVVGLNSDDSVRRLKGSTRPILEEGDRASILAALECVDMVVVFEEDTPLELIRTLRPDVLVKGADYTRETVVGYELVESWGGKVVLVPLAHGLSTTRIMETIQRKGIRPPP